ncbi:hypothetical protein GCM10009557_21600 [Virgisporangium ochraceum]|uniref:Uncharacterized protein n=1 Tax=Virgisporangium ochraceum TaxID=65505 RepID=A0A8J3ZMB6_9ACTN|nr:hypothetical protein Voc01_012780 [Virgisporangium ochraceum]
MWFPGSPERRFGGAGRRTRGAGTDVRSGQTTLSVRAGGRKGWQGDLSPNDDENVIDRPVELVVVGAESLATDAKRVTVHNGQ